MFVEFAEKKPIMIPSSGKASVGIKIWAKELTCIKSLEITFPGLRRIESCPIPINDFSIIYLSLFNISNGMVQIKPGDILGHVIEATYGTCAFLAWNEENKTLRVKSSLVESKFQSGNRYSYLSICVSLSW